MKSPWLAAALVALAPLALASSPAQDITDRFADALRRDDLVFLGSVVAEREPEPRAWAELRDTIETFDCLSVSRAEWQLESAGEESLALRIDIDGSGALKAAWHPVRPLPRRWFVGAQRMGTGWRITGAVTAERRLAQAMAAAPTNAEAKRIFEEATEVDRARTIASLTSEIMVPVERGELALALALAQSIGDVPAEVLVRRMRARAWLVTNAQQAIAASRETEEFARAYGGPDDLGLAVLTTGFGNPRIGTEARGTLRSVFRDLSLGSLIDAESEVRSLVSRKHSAYRHPFYWAPFVAIGSANRRIF